MYLLTAKAQVNLFDVNHYTPLHWAAIKVFINIFFVLFLFCFVFFFC